MTHTRKVRRRCRTTLGPRFSEGARRLWARGVTESKMERDLGCASGMAHRWLFGDRIPSIAWAEAMHKVYRIPMACWTQPPETVFELPRTGTDG